MFLFLVGLQVDIVSKECAESARQAFSYRLYTRVLELEAQLEVYEQDVLQWWACSPYSTYCRMMSLWRTPMWLVSI